MLDRASLKRGSAGFRLGTLTIALCVVLASALTLTPDARSQDVESVAAAAKASVGAILVESAGGVSSGTGFMAADRLVLTAFHVVDGARRIRIRFPDYPTVEARVLSSDANSDLAVIGIPALPARPLPLGDLAQVREGQRIVVVGFPRIEALGVQTATVTEGIVSAIRGNELQMQAPVSPGSSGGPVLSLRGEVIAVVRSTLRGVQQGINFATAVNAAKPLLGPAIARPVPEASAPALPSPEPPPREAASPSPALSPQGAAIPVTISLAQQLPAPRPETPRSGTGKGTVVVNAAASEIGFTFTYNGLSGQLLSAHFHRGTHGEAGPVVQTICGEPPPALAGACAQGNSGTIGGVWKIPLQIVAELRAGRLYIDFHTALNPGGEIRGQIAPPR